MTDFESPHLKGKTLEQLVDDLGRPVALPGSPVGEMYDAAIQAKLAERQVSVAELQRGVAETALTWAKMTAISTAGATLIALAALLIAAF